MTTKEFKFIAIDFDPFGGKEIEKIAVTNEPQREIWLSCELGGKEANLSYNESVSLKLEGPFILTAFEEAVKDLVARHEALRSVISTNGESLIIYKNISTELFFEDISSANKEEQKNILDLFIKKEMNSPFDLYEGPLFRFHLHKLGATTCYFTLVVHHVIGDGWSIAILLQDISKLYSAHAKKEVTVLPPPPQISEYALQEKAYVQSQEYVQTEEYWIEQYKNSQPTLDVPTDQPRPNPRTYKSRRDDFVLEKDLVTAVKKMGAKVGCSLVTTLLSSFEVLLHHLTGQDDIVVGVPAAGQSATDNYGLVGHCVNLLPLRSNPKSETLFIDYLKRRKKEILDAYDHQRFTFGSLLKKINFKRDSSRITLVPVLFNIDMGLTDGVHFHDLSFQLISNPREFENFELFVNATGNEQDLILEWSYNSYLFKPSTIQEMMEQYKFLLQETVKNPEQKLEDIFLKNTLLITKKVKDWNNTFLAYPGESSLHSLISQTAAKFPEKTALKFSTQQYTYKRLIETSNQLANLLIAEGVKKGHTIGLAVDRSPEMVICLLAILKSGAAYIPLDPDYPRERIEFMLNDSEAKMLLTSKKYQGNFESDAREILIEDAWKKLPGFSTENPPIEVRGNDLAYILYTSGSTGKPKGVMVEHHNLVNLLCSMQKMPGITEEDKLLAVTTISFDIAGLEIYLPLLQGAELVLMSTESSKSGIAILEAIKKEKTTIIQATPSTYKMMLDAGWQEKFSLKILCCGEPMSKDLAGKLLPRCASLYNMYGPTETTIYSTGTQIFSTDEIITIGHPIHNTQVYILDDKLNVLPEGLVGEIYLAGDGVARGYLNRPELTSEKFLANPFAAQPGSKMYRTGDLGKYLPNGKIHCLGRIDHQVKIRGYRIELGEIEHSLNQQKGIKESVVVAREDQPGDQRLVAYIVPEEYSHAENDGLDWRDRWDDLYDLAAKEEQDLDISEQKLDLAIGTQYNTEADIREQLDEWGKEGVKRVQAFNAKKIMELGCGGGQILFEVAPDTDFYIARDYSKVAIGKVNERKMSDPERWANITASVGAADDFNGVPDHSLDLVFAHGVFQYFPDLDYVIKVIQNAVKVIKPGGAIYIGDMQTLSALRMHYATDELNLVDENISIAEFKKIIDRRLDREEELIADPAFFYFLRGIIPQITAVDIQLRRGKFLNEGTKCHYDIWLYIGEAPAVVDPDISLEWDSFSSVKWMEDLLLKNPSGVLQITGIPNSRIAKDYALLKLLNTSDASVKISELKGKIVQVDEGIDPELLWDLGAKNGFNAHVRWPKDGSSRNVEVVYIPKNKNAIPNKPLAISIDNAQKTDFEKSAVEKVNVSNDQQRLWKSAIKDALPSFMVPGEFVFLKKLPLTANGKIDRNLLPKPDHNTAEDQYVAPRTENEKFLAATWSEFLDIEKVSVTDDFFELGGHSLIAIKIIFQIEKKLGLRLPITTLFENSTIEKIANKIDQIQSNG